MDKTPEPTVTLRPDQAAHDATAAHFAEGSLTYWREEAQKVWIAGEPFTWMGGGKNREGTWPTLQIFRNRDTGALRVLVDGQDAGTGPFKPEIVSLAPRWSGSADEALRLESPTIRVVTPGFAPTGDR